MQAFADRAAINETLQTGLATFYSRSRQVRLHWISSASAQLKGRARGLHQPPGLIPKQHPV
jgi:phosphoribosyl-AMP cyclohydrolase